MFNAFLGSAAAVGLVVFAVVVPAGGVTAQDGGETPAAAEPAAAEPGPDGEELSDDEIRELLSQQTVDRWTRWKQNRGNESTRACSDYNDGQGPALPAQVYCSPEDVPADQIQQYREDQRQQRSTFITEPSVKF